MAKQWDADALAELSKKQLETLANNAQRLGNEALMLLCEAEISSRTPNKGLRSTSERQTTQGDYVGGYHFVCSSKRGVIDDNDGTFWTGSWIVARANVDTSLKFGAYVALHESKNEKSYLQGEIIDYRLRERDMVDKENVGIEFRCRITKENFVWVGAGSGEKGYLWLPIATTKKA